MRKILYYIISKFGPQGGYLKMLSNEIMKCKYHGVEMIQDTTEQDLMNAMAFQKQLALPMCNTSKSRFEDNHIMATFKALGPTNMSSKQVGSELLCDQYGYECEIERSRFPLVNLLY